MGKGLTMERRNFVKGLLLSATAGTALVKLANPEEIHSLTVQKDVILNQPHVRDIQELIAYDLPHRDVYIRDGRGQFIPVGMITRIEQRMSMTKCVRYSGEAIFIPDARDVRFFFEGHGNYT
jgi:hypothetical protein